MKFLVVLVIAILASGCASVPRPYDGVIGYRVVERDGARQVVYIDEAKVNREKTLAKISDVCATQANPGLGDVSVKVISEEEYLADVGVDIPIAVGSTFTGDKAGMGGSRSAAVNQSVRQVHAMTRQMKLRKIEAVCTQNAP